LKKKLKKVAQKFFYLKLLVILAYNYYNTFLKNESFLKKVAQTFFYPNLIGYIVRVGENKVY